MEQDTGAEALFMVVLGMARKLIAVGAMVPDDFGTMAKAFNMQAENTTLDGTRAKAERAADYATAIAVACADHPSVQPSLRLVQDDE